MSNTRVYGYTLNLCMFSTFIAYCISESDQDQINTYFKYLCLIKVGVCTLGTSPFACLYQTISSTAQVFESILLIWLIRVYIYPSECLSPSALRKVSRRCHGRANCSVLADTQNFGDPCFPGTRKHLRVSFTCGMWLEVKEPLPCERHKHHGVYNPQLKK